MVARRLRMKRLGCVIGRRREKPYHREEMHNDQASRRVKAAEWRKEFKGEKKLKTQRGKSGRLVLFK